jgi:hypothetical protein
LQIGGLPLCHVSIGAAPGWGLSMPGEAAVEPEFPPFDGGKRQPEMHGALLYALILSMRKAENHSGLTYK